MVRHLRTIGLFGMALMIAFSVMLPQATTAREVANTTPDDAKIMLRETHLFAGFIDRDTTRCHDLPVNARHYDIYVNTESITDFFLLENEDSKVQTTRAEFGTEIIKYYRFSSTTQLQICATNLYIYGSSYNITVYI